MLNKARVQNVKGCFVFRVMESTPKVPTLILGFDWAPFVLQTFKKDQLGLRNKTKTRDKV